MWCNVKRFEVGWCEVLVGGCIRLRWCYVIFGDGWLRYWLFVVVCVLGFWVGEGRIFLGRC